MSTVLLVARCALAAVFCVAAISKLADRDRFRVALDAFGAPAHLTAPLSLAIPVLELAIAVLLLPAGTAQGAAIAAMALLTVFSVVIGRALREGVEADCACFGATSSSVSIATQARNAGLIVLAAPVALAGPGDSLGATDVSASALLALAALLAVVALGVFSWRLFRQNGRLLQRARCIEGALAEALFEEPSPTVDPRSAQAGSARVKGSISQQSRGDGA